ncbi:FliM/FliN family flagellar motor C-terminal domain-containing protein [Lignipirellula cremea]|uniref:Flagellar motor switch protein FliN n=1 Tax=Lignipirellula cremea TaxID=2528010 RepID=A0A518DNH1_9BACT|nr:FliM/FliN family flagellar motor C-terminal domain-containing protein [Lignipirellula cremea]QDU93382.1 Flagellar motor switch protein FliN [Lignipirellula cremea]
MPLFGPSQAAEVLAACRAGAEEAQGAFVRSFDLPSEMEAGEAGPWSAGEAASGLAGPGLVLSWTVEETCALFLIPASPLLPDWVKAPSNPTEKSKLATLSQELAATLLPEEYFASRSEIAWVEDLSAAVAETQPAENALALPITFTAEGARLECSLLWPVARALPAEETEPAPKKEKKPAPPVAESAPAPAAAAKKPLPSYARSLLKIRVPVRVTLAATRQSVTRILELGPGSIIQFEKSCEESLTLEVGEQHVAEGEAVRVGDRFGFRITSIVQPEERFWKVNNGRRVQ